MEYKWINRRRGERATFRIRLCAQEWTMVGARATEETGSE